MNTDSLTERVATEIRLEMVRQRKTGVDLSNLLNCSQQAASRRLTGKVALDLDEIATIAGWLGVEPTALIPWPAAMASTG